MQDLWADYAGEALITGETDRRGGLRRRRLTEQAALMTLRAWLLRDYMLAYGTSLGATRIFQRCYWLDGLGSPRASMPGPLLPAHFSLVPAEPSLPLAWQLAGETAQKLVQLERPIALYSFVLDEKRRKRKMIALDGMNGQHPDEANNGNVPGKAGAGTSGALWPKEGGIIFAGWPEAAPALLASLEQSAAVFLLNPLRQPLFRYADLAPLYQRTAPTELFLWLSHKQIETQLLPSLRTPEGAAALTNLLRGDRWKSLLAREPEHSERVIHGLVDLLEQSMRPHFLSVQQLVFPIHGGPALVEPAPFSLLFATRRQDSLLSMNDAVCKRARQLLTESQRGILHEEWFSLQRASQAATRRNVLTQETLSLGRAQRVRRWSDLRQQLLLNHFGQQTVEEYDQLIVSLLAQGKLRCEWRKRALEQPGVAIPGNEDLLLW